MSFKQKITRPPGPAMDNKRIFYAGSTVGPNRMASRAKKTKKPLGRRSLDLLPFFVCEIGGLLFVCFRFVFGFRFWVSS